MPCSDSEACVLGSCVSGVVDVEAGFEHTCALTGEGNVRCWGANGSGQLGVGHTNDIGDDELPSTSSDADLGGNRAVGLALGKRHTCALLDSGRVLCWGANDSNQLGVDGVAQLFSPDPSQPVSTVAFAVAVAAGETHTCAIVESVPGTREVLCWGNPASGRLGIPNSIEPLPDTPVDLGGVNVAAVALGLEHTCALRVDGEVYCWGSNSVGALGIGTPDTIGDDEAPIDGGQVELAAPARRIAAGQAFTCAVLDTSPVQVTCWGRNAGGKLGYGSGQTFGDNLGDNEAVKGYTVPLGTDAGILNIASGYEHTCVEFNDGTVQCWGVNNDGQLGLGQSGNVGDNEPASNGYPLQAPVPLAVAGGYHTCMLTNTGGVRCWGRGGRGQRGYMTTLNYGAAAGEIPDNLPDVAVFP